MAGVSFFKVPAFLRPRRSFQRLRSFHLTPAQVVLEMQNDNLPDPSAAAKPEKHESQVIVAPKAPLTMPVVPAGFTTSLSGKAFALLTILASLFFIGAISCAFIGADLEEPYFKEMLDEVTRTSPGVVLLGESVDVDVDEPSITIRWSILACGEDFILSGSGGAHGSRLCGLPSERLYIYVDSDKVPTAAYNPEEIPYNRVTGERRNIQNLVQFDSDHVLDVHEARLYPFDTYFLTSTLRATNFRNETVPIRRLHTIDITSSFDIITKDMESFTNTADNEQVPSRDIDMLVRRPGEARAITLLLFGLAWVLTHVTVGHVILARRLEGVRPLIKHLLSSGAILITIPQLRNSMPDAPGFDGVLIDCIGYFPQMVITSISVIFLLFLLVIREIDGAQGLRHSISQTFAGRSWPPRPPSNGGSLQLHQNRARPPAIPHANSNSLEIARYEMHRMMKHLKGQYVFPPVNPSTMHNRRSSREANNAPPVHRRVQTLARIPEHAPRSRFSVDITEV